jgi:hypothetical protein
MAVICTQRTVVVTAIDKTGQTLRTTLHMPSNHEETEAYGDVHVEEQRRSEDPEYHPDPY